ncbi:hypothetical protein C0995_011226 [Termitomyces sp. Mi166|nr:hypothetical protein C0995_011226 [Termitomyces sp. Mi166\
MSSPTEPSTDTPQSKTSKKFHASDADVVFQSSDNVLFHLHRKNLETQAAGFPPSEFSTDGEIVSLTEDAATLENLFEYVYPRRHPEVELLSVDELLKLAEAAEKYEVFNVMNMCRTRIYHEFAFGNLGIAWPGKHY